MSFHIRFATGLLAWAASLAAFAGPQILTTEQWREDLLQLSNAITRQHPMPFRAVDQAAFAALVANLENDLPAMTDKEIIVRLCGIVAAVRDGHTRLSIPRQHPAIGLEFGHTGTSPPNFPELAFRQLPLAFEQFEDGVFVVAASAGHRDTIGARLVAIEGTPAPEAMHKVQAVTFAENAQLEKLMGADRLSLPEVLVALGIAKDSQRVRLTLETTGEGRVEIAFEPLGEGSVEWISKGADLESALRNRFPGRTFWSLYLPGDNMVYAQINEIADSEISLARFVAEVIGQAEEMDAKLVIDLRSNFGGSGGLNRSLELGLIQSAELNQYGRSFVLIGRRTFSAAQMLANVLEKYTRVLFVGEPTGARPDHYGDSRKTRLAHSGLTLRVSSLHWSSQAGNDSRDYLVPDLPAPWTSAAFFAGGDPALEAVRSYSADFTALVRNALDRDEQYALARYLTGLRRSPDTHDVDFSRTLLAIGNQFIAEGKLQKASLAFRYGIYFYPGNEALEAALQALQANSG